MSKTILLVEDEENDVLLLRRAMRKAGIEDRLQIAADGKQALEYLQGKGDYENRTKHPLPCLILLDLKLPRLMGMEVLKWIRQKCAIQTVVLILTSSQSKTDIEQAYRLGANAYLVKPTDSHEYVDMTDSIKRFWLTHNQPTSNAEH